MLEFRYKYTYTPEDGVPDHLWQAISAPGAVSLEITDHSGGRSFDLHDYSGWFDVHYRSPPPHLAGEPHSDDHCPILHVPCWIDRIAADQWIPLWRHCPNDHDSLFERIAAAAREVFSGQIKHYEGFVPERKVGDDRPQ